jgi:hypothetical protein
VEPGHALQGGDGERGNEDSFSLLKGDRRGILSFPPVVIARAKPEAIRSLHSKFELETTRFNARIKITMINMI